MKRTVLLLITLAALLAGAAVAQAATVYFSGAVGGRQVKPRMLSLTADGTLEVTGMRWRTWGGATAVGHGQAEYHGCTPNCASGKDHHAAVTVRLSRIRTCSHRSYYSHVSLTQRSGKALDPGFLRISWKPCH